MINKKTQYALKAVQALALKSGEGPVLIADLAEQEGIPKKFLEQILLDLKRDGILSSVKGKGGGYNLAKPASQIFVGHIVRAIEGSLALVPCASEQDSCEACKDTATCSLRIVMKEAGEKMAAVLDGASIEYLMKLQDELGRSRNAGLDYVI